MKIVIGTTNFLIQDEHGPGFEAPRETNWQTVVLNVTQSTFGVTAVCQLRWVIRCLFYSGTISYSQIKHSSKKNWLHLDSNPQPFSKRNVYDLCVVLSTKTNTNNNTWPVVQLNSNKTQPIGQVLHPRWCKWIAWWAEDIATKLVG